MGLFALLPIFAIAYGLADSKRQQIAVILGYYFGSLWSLGGVFDGFWPTAAPWVGLAGWAGATIMIAVPWALMVFVGPDTATMRGVRFFVSLLISSLPPLGAYGLASPWIYVPSWFPGTGIYGLIMGAIWLSLLVVWSREVRGSVTGAPHLFVLGQYLPSPKKLFFTQLVLTFGIIWAIIANLTYQSPAQPEYWAVVQTDLAGFRGAVPASIWEHRQGKVARIVFKAIRSHPDHTRILFPENISGPHFPNFFSALLDRRMASMARAHGDTLLIGADDIDSRHGDYTDSINIMGRYQGRISARQPVPFGEWRPWDHRTALADWWHLGGYQLGNKTAAWAICYEQMLVWPIAWNFLGDGNKPSVLLAPSNHDWASHSLEPYVQKQALMAWARLYQVPVLYANNRPPKQQP